jgi:hypothetical protein
MTATIQPTNNRSSAPLLRKGPLPIEITAQKVTRAAFKEFHIFQNEEGRWWVLSASLETPNGVLHCKNDEQHFQNLVTSVVLPILGQRPPQPLTITANPQSPTEFTISANGQTSSVSLGQNARSHFQLFFLRAEAGQSQGKLSVQPHPATPATSAARPAASTDSPLPRPIEDMLKDLRTQQQLNSSTVANTLQALKSHTQTKPPTPAVPVYVKEDGQCYEIVPTNPQYRLENLKIDTKSCAFIPLHTGSHFIAMLYDNKKNQIILYDPYGRDPRKVYKHKDFNEPLQAFIDNNWEQHQPQPQITVSEKQEQTDGTHCGAYVIRRYHNAIDPTNALLKEEIAKYREKLADHLEQTFQGLQGTEQASPTPFEKSGDSQLQIALPQISCTTEFPLDQNPPPAAFAYPRDPKLASVSDLNRRVNVKITEPGLCQAEIVRENGYQMYRNLSKPTLANILIYDERSLPDLFATAEKKGYKSIAVAVPPLQGRAQELAHRYIQSFGRYSGEIHFSCASDEDKKAFAAALAAP